MMDFQDIINSPDPLLSPTEMENASDIGYALLASGNTNATACLEIEPVFSAAFGLIILAGIAALEVAYDEE